MARASTKAPAKASSKTGAKKSTAAKSPRKKAATTAKPPAGAKAKAPAKAEVLTPIQQLRSDIDGVFEDFTRSFNLPSLRSRLLDVGAWQMPRLSLSETVAPMNVSETDKAIDITIELPGMDEGDVEVSVADDMLTISGEKTQEETREVGEVHVRERSFGSFRRSFRLPSGADADKIAAAFNKGVLTITVPKPPVKKSAAKKIKVLPRR